MCKIRASPMLFLKKCHVGLRVSFIRNLRIELSNTFNLSCTNTTNP